MLILSEFDIQFQLPAPTPMVALLHLYPTLGPRVRSGNELLVESSSQSNFGGAAAAEHASVILPSIGYIDSFGNRCTRFLAPAGSLKLSGKSIVDADTSPDQAGEGAKQMVIQDLPSDVLQFLLPSRYCQVDQFGGIANDLFGSIPSGWAKAVAIRDWVHSRVAFNYNAARPTKTAMDVLTERVGVCRDFQHLAVTLSRCQNIPARYATGYIGDIQRPYSGPGDFSAWYQVFLDDRWMDLDARHNFPRLGRLLMAVGRDAADVAITTSFGSAFLTNFYVESIEIDAEGNKLPLPRFVGDTQIPSPPNDFNTPTQSNNNTSSPVQTQPATL